MTTLLVFALLKIRAFIPDGPFADGIREVFLAVVIFVWTLLFMGKEKLTPKPDGFAYAFRLLRGYYIFLGTFALLELAGAIALGESNDIPVKLVNAVLMGATVGIVEEFSFRGLIFGGIIQKMGNSKKNIIVAAVVSGLVFGAMHIIYSALSGEITSLGTALTSLLKIAQTGIFGVILAFIYIKTRNIYVVAALHSLDDFLLFFVSAFSGSDSVKNGSYVSGSIGVMVVGYLIFTLVMVPFLIKSIKDINENELIPFDDDFKPIAVKYEKTKRK